MGADFDKTQGIQYFTFDLKERLSLAAIYGAFAIFTR